MASADPTRLVELAAVSAVHGNLFYAKHLFHRVFVWSGICYRLLVDSNHSAGIASGGHAFHSQRAHILRVCRKATGNQLNERRGLG
jgi:hypothetical protein